MQLAPRVNLSGESGTLAAGLPGMRQTLATMRRLVTEARQDVRIRQTALHVVFPVAARNTAGEIAALLRYVQNEIRYTPDVLEVETLAHPVTTLQTRAGDCDDFSTLLASLCETVGIPTRFVCVAYQYPGMFEHVYLQAFDGVQWWNLDATQKGPIGYAPPNAVSIFIEGN